jgi:hypothetical protein
MDFGEALKNPWVLGGGAVLAGLIILSNMGKGASSGPRDASIAANASYNTAAMSAVTNQANIAAKLGAVQYTQDTARQANVLGYLTSLDNNRTTVEAQYLASESGVINNSITQSAAVVIDVNNNSTRLGLGYQSADVSKHNSDNGVLIANAQAKASIAQSSNAMWASIAKQVGTAAVAIAGH